MKQVGFFIAAFLTSSIGICQEYKTLTKNADGFTSVYQTVTRGSGYYAKSASRYGLIDEKTKKIVLPFQYASVYSAAEPGIYIVKDTLDKQGLFSATAGKFITEIVYTDIESFSDGLAVVKQYNVSDLMWGAVDKTGALIIPQVYEYLGNVSEGLMNFEKDNLLGFIDKQNKVVIPATYSNISSFHNGLAPVKMKETGLFGYIDKNNNFVIPAKYVAASDFYNGYAVVNRKVATAGKRTSNDDAEVALIDAKGNELTGFDYNAISFYLTRGYFSVRKADKTGVIDSTGKLIIPMEYLSISNGVNDNIQVKTADNKYGLLNKKGAVLLAPEYDYISSLYNDKIFYYYKNGKRGVMDKDMKQIIPLDSAEMIYVSKAKILFTSSDKVKIFDMNGKLLRTINQANISPFTSKLVAEGDSFLIKYDASVQLINLTSNAKKAFSYKETGGFNEEGIFLARKVQYGFFDFTGKKLNTKDYYSAVAFSDGICAVQETDKSTPYLADKNFNKIKDLDVTFYGPFSEGIGMATSGTSVVYIDKKGDRVFSTTGKEGTACKNGLIWIKDNYNYYYLVDKKGKKVVSTLGWPAVGEFSEGMAAIKVGEKWGFIDSTGATVIPAKFGVVSSFEKGVAVAYENGSYFMINKKGERINNKTYDGASTPANGSFVLSQDKKVGLVDNKGNVIIEFKYINVMPMSDERVWAAKDGKWGLLDNKGKELTGFIYQAANQFENGFAGVKINNKWGLINKAGKLVVPAEYSNIGAAYKNSVLTILPEGSLTISLK